jgi:mono/diheme cytochrome c family protein
MRSLLLVLFVLGVAVAATLSALPRPTPANPLPSAPTAELADSAFAESTQLPLIDPTLAGPATSAQLSRGARVYRSLCLACHLPDGKGMSALVPPLVAADFMFADRERAIRTVLKGLAGPITVNGVGYQGVMPALEQVLTDQQVADVLTYVFNTWGNSGEAFAPAHIGLLRAEWSALPGVVAPPTPGF